jgi:hypothetical protein
MYKTTVNYFYILGGVLVVYMDGGGLNSRDDRKTTWHETAPISSLSMAIILTTRAWMTCI